MSEYICPECGAILIRGEHNFEAHAIGHWGVNKRGAERLPNELAKARYKAILDAEAEPEIKEEETMKKNDTITINGGVL